LKGDQVSCVEWHFRRVDGRVVGRSKKSPIGIHREMRPNQGTFLTGAGSRKTPGVCLGDEKIHSLLRKDYVMSSEIGSPVTVQESPQYVPPPPPPLPRNDDADRARAGAESTLWLAQNQQHLANQGVFNNKT
jgi:hypothetical protein